MVFKATLQSQNQRIHTRMKTAGLPGPTKSQQAESISTNISGNVEIQEMDRMRKLIAEHMVRSKQTSPHVTSFSEADVTNLVTLARKRKNGI